MLRINLLPKRAPWGISYQKENDEQQILDADLEIGGGFSLYFDDDPDEQSRFRVEALDKHKLLITMRPTSGNLIYLTIERR